MNSPLDPETLKIPAFLRKKAIVSQARQKLILTALDRKEAGLSPKSKKALAPTKYVTPARSTVRPVRRSMEVAISRPIEETPRFDISPQKLPKIGTVTHFLEKIDVAIIKLTAPLGQGDNILIEGKDYLFIQSVEEMQIDRKPVVKAKKGSHIGMKVAHKPVINGQVYRLNA